MASEDLSVIFRAARSFAETMLSVENEFIPFGVLMANDGSVIFVAGDVGSERPDSKEVVDLLQSSCEEMAMKGEIRAAAVCLDTRILPPNWDAKTDAICVRLAHISGENMVLFVPYSKQKNESYKFREIFAIHDGLFTLPHK